MQQPQLEDLPKPDSTVGSLLRDAAERFGEAPFLTDGAGRTLNRVELDREASQCANALLALGLEKGSTVGLFSPNTIEFVTAGYGILRSGLTMTPFNSSYKRRELLHQVRDSGASVVLADERLLPTIEECAGDLPGCQIRKLERSFWAEASDAYPEVEIDRMKDVAVLPYSSGTVGLSKGIELSQANLIAAMRQILYTSKEQFVGAGESAYCFLPLYHIYGFNIVLNPSLAIGCHLHLRERFDMDDCLDTIEREKITWLPVVPPVVLGFLMRPDLAERDLKSLRVVSVGAAPVPVAAMHRFTEITGVAVGQGFGMTETAGIASFSPLDAEWDMVESAGPPILDAEMKIFDMTTGEKELPVNETGELAVRGPNVMMGYHNAPEENRRAFRNGWFYTGDIGKIDELGRLHLVDRKREMIKYKGFQVMPAELEAVMLELPEVADCAVIGKKDPEAGEIPKAFVVLKEGSALTEQKICDYIASQVAGYKQVREMEFITAIPRSPAGKVLRRILIQREAGA